MATFKEVVKALCAMLNDLGKMDDSGVGENSEHLVLKREREEKRAALYRYTANATCCCSLTDSMV